MSETIQEAIPNVGIGLYSMPEVSRIIGVESRKLRRWAKEYAHHADGTTRYHVPVIARHFGAGDDTLTFLELIELLFVKLFREAGVTMPTIRAASQRFSELFDARYPFTVKRFDTDGQHIFVTLRQETNDQELLQDIAKGQLAFEEVVRPYFHNLDYDDDAFVRRFWPLGHEGRIVLDPRRRFGAPIDAETGIPTAVLYDAVHAGKTGQSIEAVAWWFEVPRAAVEVAVRYETFLRAA